MTSRYVVKAALSGSAPMPCREFDSLGVAGGFLRHQPEFKLSTCDGTSDRCPCTVSERREIAQLERSRACATRSSIPRGRADAVAGTADLLSCLRASTAPSDSNTSLIGARIRSISQLRLPAGSVNSKHSEAAAALAGAGLTEPFQCARIQSLPPRTSFPFAKSILSGITEGLPRTTMLAFFVKAVAKKSRQPISGIAKPWSCWSLLIVVPSCRACAPDRGQAADEAHVSRHRAGST